MLIQSQPRALRSHQQVEVQQQSNLPRSRGPIQTPVGPPELLVRHQGRAQATLQAHSQVQQQQGLAPGPQFLEQRVQGPTQQQEQHLQGYVSLDPRWFLARNEGCQAMQWLQQAVDTVDTCGAVGGVQNFTCHIQMPCRSSLLINHNSTGSNMPQHHQPECSNCGLLRQHCWLKREDCEVDTHGLPSLS